MSDSETEDILPDELPQLGGGAAAKANRYKGGRRISVSAESMDPNGNSVAAADEPFKKTVIKKTKPQQDKIAAAVKNNFLFKQLDEEQYKQVIDAIGEKKVKSGEVVIKQGDVGDFFYIVDDGSLSVYVKSAAAGAGDDGKYGKKVTSYAAGGSFGELALMYNAPRAATVIADKDSSLWALDRVTFRHILMNSTFRKRKMYDTFLSEVSILKSLESYERSKIADALESCVFEDGQVVIKQGDVGETFYIIEQGEALAKQKDDHGKEHDLPSMKKGDYFGELALVLNKPRAATIIAKGKLKCVSLNKQAFDRLLGPALEILQRNMQNYAALTRRKSIKDLIEKMEKEVKVKA